MRIGHHLANLGLLGLLFSSSLALAQTAQEPAGAPSAASGESPDAEPDDPASAELSAPGEPVPERPAPGGPAPGGPAPGGPAPAAERSFELPTLSATPTAQAPGVGTVPALTPATLAAPSQDTDVVEVTQPVPPTGLLGVGLVPHHYDDVGYPESPEGLLIIELDPQVGPITMFRGTQPHYIEAQFVNTQRDAVWLARQGVIRDVLPNEAVGKPTAAPRASPLRPRAPNFPSSDRRVSPDPVKSS